MLLFSYQTNRLPPTGEPVTEPMPAIDLWNELGAIQIIRTETVLSKLPVHNLSKTGDFEILIHAGREFGALDFIELKHAVMLIVRPLARLGNFNRGPGGVQAIRLAQAKLTIQLINSKSEARSSKQGSNYRKKE